MRYVVTVQHPAHVHFFRHAIRELEAAGHDVHLFARDAEVTVDLLEAYGLEHRVLANGQGGGAIATARAQLAYEYRLLDRSRAIQPDVLTAVGGTAVAHVSTLTDARSVVFTDTEHAPANRITIPFADEVWTPACFRRDFGAKQIAYPGLHELAYLHPNRFDPDPAVLEAQGIDPDERLVVLRTVAWEATHDVGEAGFRDVGEAIEHLEASGARVVVTSESPLPKDLRDRRLAVPPHRLHHVLAFADLFVGEGATTAVEAAVLGTPAVYVNSLRMGYIDEVERFGLLFGFDGEDRHARALSTARDLLACDADWTARRADLLDETVDTTEVVVDALAP